MKYSEYKILLGKFLDGKTVAEENDRLSEAMPLLPDDNFECYSKGFWTGNDSMDAGAKIRMKKNIFRSAGLDGRRQLRRRIVAAVSIAASLLLAAFGGYRLASDNDELRYCEVVAERGQKSVVTLPDGTKVWLNSASVISYPSDYNRKNRNVRLDGEAYFEVAHSEKKPFIVEANGLTVKVLGTKFNVSAYHDNLYVVTTLVEGKVMAYSENQNVTLLPAQQVRYDKNSGMLEKSDNANVNHLVPWLDGEIVFDHDSLEDIARILERMYNVNIIFSDESVKQYSYTGLVRNNSLVNVLNLISATSPVEYRMYNDTIKISRVPGK